jgi:predicted metal-dependent peptidase
MTPEWLQASRLRASHARPYFAHALWSLVPLERSIGTLAVDVNWRLYYDPALEGKWTVEEIAWVLIHEVNHLLRDHATRALPSTKVWKIAADLEINSSMRQEGSHLPACALYPEKYGLEEGLLAETYYQQLSEAQEVPEPGQGQSGGKDDTGGPPGDGNAGDSSEGTKDEDAASAGVEGCQAAPSAGECGSCCTGIYEPWEIREEGGTRVRSELIRARVAQDMVQTKGNVPGEWERWAQDQLRPRVDWRRALRSHVYRAVNIIMGKDDYTYCRPSRRQSVMGNVILPSTCAHAPRTVIVMDTSGSISDEQLDQAVAEVNGILRTLRIIDRVTVLAVDAEVRAVWTMSRRMSQREFPGGGGTKMEVGVAEAMRHKPELIIVITDGLTDWPKRSPGVPVVICLIDPKHYGDRWRWTFPLPDWARVVEVEDLAA